MHNILVSIILPVYNSEQFIANCINSILKQTYRNIQLVIINDCSTDNTDNIIKTFNDSRILYISNPKNFGISKTQNIGIELSKGEYIAIMNSDDVMVPNRIEKQVSFLNSFPSIDIIGGEIQLQYSNNTGLLPNRFKKLKINHDDIAKQLKHSTAIDHITLMARSKVFKLVKYNEYLPAAVDLDFELRALSLGFKFHNLSDVLCTYRIHNSSTGSQRRDKQLRGAYYAHKMYNERLRYGKSRTDLSLVDFSVPSSLFEKIFLDLSVINREDTFFTKISRLLVSPFSSLGRYCLKRKIIKFLSE